MTAPAILAIGSAGGYAMALVLAQIGLRHQSALAGATISLPTTAIVLWLLAFVFPLQHFHVRALVIFAGLGALYPVAVTLLSFEANRHLGPTLAGALGNVTPLIAVAFGVIVLGETVAPGRMLGVLILLAGVVLLSLRGRVEARWLGWALLLPFAAALIRGIVQPMVKLGLADWPEPFAAALIGYTVSATIILMAGFLRGSARRPVWTRRGAPIFILIGLCNGSSLLLMYLALSEATVSLVAPLVAIYPLFTLAFSAVLLRTEAIHARLLIGVALTVLGVAIVLAG